MYYALQARDAYWFPVNRLIFKKWRMVMSLDTVKMDSPGKEVFMLGNEMIARGAIEAGVSVVACYPGTPSSEISDTLAAVSKDFGFQMEYSANEKVALEVAAGAAIAGANSLAIMKHVGLNVASDAFFSLAYTGVSGALVIIVCDDPFMFSSQTEEDTRIIAECANMPVLDPTNAVEAKEMIKEITGKREKKAREAIDKIRSTHTVKVATKTDIEALQEKIDALTAKIDSLKGEETPE